LRIHRGCTKAIIWILNDKRFRKRHCQVLICWIGKKL
jgi:hypothetical protein